MERILPTSKKSTDNEEKEGKLNYNWTPGRKVEEEKTTETYTKHL